MSCITLTHTQAWPPLVLIFLAITRFNWWKWTKSTTSTTEQQCSHSEGSKEKQTEKQTTTTTQSNKDRPQTQESEATSRRSPQQSALPVEFTCRIITAKAQHVTWWHFGKTNFQLRRWRHRRGVAVPTPQPPWRPQTTTSGRQETPQVGSAFVNWFACLCRTIPASESVHR